MIKIGVVGDLSGGSPGLLAHALDAALAASDIVVQVGDMMPGYAEVKQRLASPSRLLPVPGNHDVDYDSIGWPRQWSFHMGDAILVGIDNSADVLSDAAWSNLKQAEGATVPVFVFGHKSPAPILREDGTTSFHIMGESPNLCPDGIKLWQWLKDNKATFVCGHLHAWAWTRHGADDIDVICEGRGGAAGTQNLGYSLIVVNGGRWTCHAVQL